MRNKITLINILFVMSIDNIFCQIADSSKVNEAVVEFSSIKPRFSYGFGSPELFNFGAALKYKKFQIAGIYGMIKSEGLFAVDIRVKGVEITFLNYHKNKSSTNFYRINFYNRVNTFSMYKNIEKYFLFLAGKEFDYIEIHYGFLYRFNGRLEKINLKYNEPYKGWGSPFWPTVGARVIIE